MADVQVFDAGTLEQTSPAAVLANALAMGVYGCLTLFESQTAHRLYLTGGTLAGTADPVERVLCKALALENGRYELSSALPVSFSLHDPWRSLQAAALGILGKSRLTMLGRGLRPLRIEPVASPLHAWAAGIPEAAKTLAEVTGRTFGEVEKPRMRTLVNLVLLREMGLVAWPAETLGLRPLLWREVEAKARENTADHDVVELTDNPPAPDAPSPADLQIEITVDDAAAEDIAGPTPAAAPEASASLPPPDDGAGALLDGSAFDEGLMFLRAGSLGAAKYRFEDHLRFRPDDHEAAAYVTWIDMQEDLRDATARKAALGALELALARKQTADLLTFKARILRIEGKYDESLRCLEDALRLDAKHANARFEYDQVRRRLRTDEWPEVNVEDVRVDAVIILQRRIGSQIKVFSFKQPEIRVGSGDNDDVVVSTAVLPQVAKRHCTVTSRNGRLWIRRNASLGRVFVNGRELEIRKDVAVGADDCVRLGEGTPGLEFRVFGVNYLHDLSVLATGGIR